MVFSMGFVSFLRLGMLRSRFLCIFHSVLGLSSTRDGCFPLSTTGVRETDEKSIDCSLFNLNCDNINPVI